MHVSSCGKPAGEGLAGIPRAAVRPSERRAGEGRALRPSPQAPPSPPGPLLHPPRRSAGGRGSVGRAPRSAAQETTFPLGVSRPLPKTLVPRLFINSCRGAGVPPQPTRKPPGRPEPAPRRPSARPAAPLPARLPRPPGLSQRRVPPHLPFFWAASVPFPSRQHHFP